MIWNLKEHIRVNYLPCKSPQEADFHCTTSEVYEKLLAIFPNTDMFTLSDVATWLNEGGFVFCDFGNMRLEWLFKHKSIDN